MKYFAQLIHLLILSLVAELVNAQPGQFTLAEGNTSAEQISVQTRIEPPTIAGIIPLSEESALVWWDSVDGNATEVILQATDAPWKGFTDISRINARQGWMTVNDLEILREYTFRLVATTTNSISAAGKETSYQHKNPLVEWGFVPEGTFILGGLLDDETPQRNIQLSAYLMSKGEITNQLYLQYCSEEKVGYPETPNYLGIREYLQDYREHPVVNVSWYDAIGFCNWLSKALHLSPAYDKNGGLLNLEGIRLPTEAEWEHAARIGGGEYPWGNLQPSRSLANFKQLSRNWDLAGSHPQKKGSYPPTPGGFWDLAGNVWEWCHDWYLPEAYRFAESINPRGPSQGLFKVVRGGSWADSPSMLRSCNRSKLSPEISLSTVGFRVVRSVPIKTLNTE